MEEKPNILRHKIKIIFFRQQFSLFFLRIFQLANAFPTEEDVFGELFIDSLTSAETGITPEQIQCIQVSWKKNFICINAILHLFQSSVLTSFFLFISLYFFLCIYF